MEWYRNFIYILLRVCNLYSERINLINDVIYSDMFVTTVEITI